MTAALGGLSVWVTRPTERADPTAQALRASGARVAQVPFVRIVPLPLPTGAETLREIDRIVLTSPTAAEHFVRALATNSRLQSWHLPCHAVGEATAELLRRAGFSDVRVADGAHADALAAAVLADAQGPERMLLPGSRIRRAQLPHALNAAGHRLVLWDLYDTAAATHLPADARAQLLHGERPLLLLYSPSAAAAVRALIGDATLVRELPCAVLGPTTAETALAEDLHVVVQPAQIGESALLRAIALWWASR